jgi:adenylate kinase
VRFGVKIVFLGAPGAGKGTQAELVSKALGIPVIGLGHMIREEIKKDTALGKQLKEISDAGQLLPDETAIEMVTARIKQQDCEKGCALDAFPRTVFQAEALESIGSGVDLVVNLQISDEIIIERLKGRRECPKCFATYHLIAHPPKAEGVCDFCKTALITRQDDHPKTVRERLEVYHQQTEPLIRYYQKIGKLMTLNATDHPQAITRQILARLEVH